MLQARSVLLLWVRFFSFMQACLGLSICLDHVVSASILRESSSITVFDEIYRDICGSGTCANSFLNLYLLLLQMSRCYHLTFWFHLDSTLSQRCNSSTRLRSIRSSSYNQHLFLHYCLTLQGNGNQVRIWSVVVDIGRCMQKIVLLGLRHWLWLLLWYNRCSWWCVMISNYCLWLIRDHHNVFSPIWSRRWLFMMISCCICSSWLYLRCFCGNLLSIYVVV